MKFGKIKFGEMKLGHLNVGQIKFEQIKLGEMKFGISLTTVTGTCFPDSSKILVIPAFTPKTAGKLTFASDIFPPQHHPLMGMHSWLIFNYNLI